MGRTIENCSVIKRAIKNGTGECGTENGKCIGYCNEGDEPCSVCIECKLNVWYEGDKNG